MSLIYTSNSPEFLTYVASCKSRAELEADPRLCVLLNDPHIKDNMEVALLAREADYGTYENKKEFIGFFLANGPELDTDTIMYYRDKILSDPEYSRIARDEFRDLEVIDNLRVNVYGKSTTASSTENGEEDDGNCFKNPCDYLQPITAQMGLIGDYENFITIGNIFSRKAKKSEEEKKTKTASAQDIATSTGADKNTSSTAKKDEEENEDTIWGNIRKHNIGRIIPAFERGYRTLLKDMELKVTEFSKKVSAVGLEKLAKTNGDCQAESISKNIGTAIKLNMFSNMGDCARLWEHMRRLRLYDSNSNGKKPMDESSVSSSKTVIGTPSINDNARNDNALKNPPKTSVSSGIGTKPGKVDKESVIKEFMQAYNIGREEATERAANVYGWKSQGYITQDSMTTKKENTIRQFMLQYGLSKEEATKRVDQLF